MHLRVHLLPAHVPPDVLRGVVVVIDQLRASSTIVAAMAAGAARIVPCLTPQDAMAARAAHGAAVLLGGERGGRLIPGFDLANAPSEYRPERVMGRTIAFTTTNGTRALLHAREAGTVLIGCLNNCDAAAHAALAAAVANGCDIHLLCAGTGGVVCLDDALAAGAIAQRIGRATGVVPDDTAMLATRAYGDASACDLLAAMRESLGGRNLIAIGMDQDIIDCTRLSVATVVPVYHAGTGELRPS